MSNPEDNRDLVAELVDRALAKQRRGEEWEFEFEVDFASFTDEERDDYIALVKERTAHGEEKVEALKGNVVALKALLRLQVQSAPGMSLREAIGSGHISMLEVVEAIQGVVPDPLAE